MNLIDTHAHLTWDSFKNDFKEVLKRAYDADVKTIINVGPDLKRSQQVINLDCSPLKSYATIGLHPHEAIKYTQRGQSMHDRITFVHRDMVKLEEIFHNNLNQIIAVGECGLDYYFREDSHVANAPRNDDSGKPDTNVIANEVKQSQKELFKSQINLAKKLNLPLIIHCRDSFDDIFISELQGTTGVFHSFTGDSDQAKKVLDLGYYLGFTCIVTYPKNEHLREIIKKAPLDKILTETDCPFLPPQTKRGQRSEPADVIEVVKIIAQMKKLSFEKAAEKTFENAVKLFKLA